MFVGREAELKKAHELLEAARSGAEAVLCLEGGPGMGKTTLSHRVVEQSRAAGLLVFNGSFVDGQDLPPLWPWRRILNKAGRFVELDSEVIPSRTGRVHASEPSQRPWVSEVHRRLLDNLDAEWDAVPGLSELPANQRKYRFFEWISAFLHDLARSMPTLIVLEDLHAGDDASLHLLQYLIDALEYSAVFFVLTWRPAELRGSSRIAKLKDQLGLLQKVAIMELERFDRHELEHYLAGATGALTAEEVDHALAWTEGVPLRAFLYLQRVAPELHGTFDPMLTMSRLFWVSLRRELSTGAVATVERLALLGNAFTRGELDTIARSAGGSEDIRVQLTAAGLIRGDDDGLWYRFFHDEVRVVVLDLLTEDEREGLIEETAAGIEAVSEPESERGVRLLKELFLSSRSGRHAEEAFRFTLKAVELAEAQDAWPEAISDLKRLLARYGEKIEPATLRELQLRLCKAYHNSFNEREGVALAVELFAFFKSTGDTERLIDLIANFEFGWAVGEVDLFPEIRALIERLPAEHPRRAELLSAVGISLTGGVDPERAIAVCETAVALARAHADLPTEIRATVRLAMCLMHVRRFEEAVTIVDRLEEKYSERIGAMELSYALWAKALALRGLGRFPELTFVVDAMTRLSHLYDDPVMRVNIRFSRDRFAIRRGAWSRLSFEEPKGSEVDFNLNLPAVTAAYLTGNVESADRFVERFMQIVGSGKGRAGERMQACWFVAVRAYVVKDRRWVDECDRYLPELVEAIGDIPGYLTDFPICAARISRLAPCSQDEAHDYYDRLVRADGWFYEDEEYTIAAAKALLTLLWNDRARAINHFEEAVAFCDKHQERPWRAHYLFELALVLPRVEIERAQRLVAEAKSEGQRLGLRPLLARIEREWPADRSAADRTGPAAATADRPSSDAIKALRAAGITRREREVLECLVGGLTDKEIAATLSISPYTVGNHLRSIYAKTECSNRGEATHWALANNVAKIDPLPRGE